MKSKLWENSKSNQIKHMEQIKLTQDEIDKIKNLQDEYNNKIIEFGQLKLEKIPIKKKWDELNERESQLEKEMQILFQANEKLANELNLKYGDGEIDIKSGIFNKNS